MKYTVNHILFPKQVKHLVQKGILTLPAQAQPAVSEDSKDVSEAHEQGQSDDDSDLFVNPNRRGGHVSSSSSESSEDEDEEEGGEEEQEEDVAQQEAAMSPG